MKEDSQANLVSVANPVEEGLPVIAVTRIIDFFAHTGVSLVNLA